jgi:glucose/arabinose dehydrogenase
MISHVRTHDCHPKPRIAPVVLVCAAALTVACAPSMDAPTGAPGALPTPILPEEREGLVAIDAPNATVRPERRGFSDEHLGQVNVPAGFTLGVFADGLDQPRVIKAAPNGDIYVAERAPGQVRLLRDTNGDGRADMSRVVTSGLRGDLRGVHGLAVHGGRLYMVTETELMSAAIQDDGGLDQPIVHIYDIPAGGQHPNRTIEFGPDGMLYLSIGSTCNACVEPMQEHATLQRIDPATWEMETFAEGLRNTIGFGWHPVSGNLYGLDHNSDGRGHDWPPEELNHIREGLHYGWPFCGGNREIDWQLPSDPDDMTRQEFCAGTEPPVLTYQGHAAPMQMVYYTANAFPPDYQNNAFVTMRGSWNRNPPVGYEVVRIRFDRQGNPTAIAPFVGNWLLEGGRAHFGRLMGITMTPDGALLVGDDTNGVIYRIAFDG